MTKQRRTFIPEFKREAVCLVLDQGYSHTEAARSLGLVESISCQWLRSADPFGLHNAWFAHSDERFFHAIECDVGQQRYGEQYRREVDYEVGQLGVFERIEMQYRKRDVEHNAVGQVQAVAHFAKGLQAPAG